MKSTREKIVSKAVEMYNEHGFANVSSRAISKELGISHGNLEYHFKNKSILINVIYENMSVSISKVYELSDQQLDPFDHFQNLLTELEALQKKYLFFNLDIIEIARKFPKVKLKLDETLNLRKSQTSIILNGLIESNYFKAEPFSGCYLRLQHTIRILITFWKSQEEILVSYTTSIKNDMSLHIWDLLTPHMTEKGKQAYFKLMK